MSESNDQRERQYNVADIFIDRWSPRAMSGESITDRELMTLFEAARWAPSAFNNQPWRFLYTKRDSDSWETFFNLLAEGNRTWVKNAAVLMVVISKKTSEYNNKPVRTHAFDTGSAWVSLALQGSISGLVVHGMAGFDYDKAKEDLGIPDDYNVEAMVAVGRPGDKNELPEKLRNIEKPSGRKEIKEIAFEDKFQG